MAAVPSSCVPSLKTENKIFVYCSVDKGKFLRITQFRFMNKVNESIFQTVCFSFFQSFKIFGFSNSMRMFLSFKFATYYYFNHQRICKSIMYLIMSVKTDKFKIFKNEDLERGLLYNL